MPGDIHRFFMFQFTEKQQLIDTFALYCVRTLRNAVLANELCSDAKPGERTERTAEAEQIINAIFVNRNEQKKNVRKSIDRGGGLNKPHVLISEETRHNAQCTVTHAQIP